MGLILYVGARLAIAGDLTVGALVAFNMLAGRVAEPVLRLAGLWQQFQEARVGVARLGDILNTPAEIVFSPSRSALPQIRSEEHTSELQSLMRTSYAVFCLKNTHTQHQHILHTYSV